MSYKEISNHLKKGTTALLDYMITNSNQDIELYILLDELTIAESLIKEMKQGK